MTCASCQHHVEEALRETAGVESARVDLMANRACVSYDPSIVTPSTLIEAVRASGYDAVLPRADASAQSSANALESGAERKAGVTLIAGAAAMLLTMPLGPEMGAFDHALMRMLPWLYALPAEPLRWFLLILTAFILAWAGRGIYLSAARGLRHGTTNMNTLVSLGTGVAFLYSAYATIWPALGRQVYFDAVLLIVGFLLLGKALEGRAKRRALAALDSLSRLRPATARRLRDGLQAIVPLEEIQPGDSVVVLPGERFPVDATIVEGRTTVDESMLTGESTPQDRTTGGRVLAGSLNYEGAVTCRAESLGEATMLAQITRMVTQAQGSRAPMERLADHASSIFVPVVLVLAALTFIVWLLATHSLQMALASTVSVLVIACPCAMGLAVPAALSVAVGRGAQLGVLFKGGEALERLAHLDVIVLDKTGTLTVGRPVLCGIHLVDGFPPLRKERARMEHPEVERIDEKLDQVRGIPGLKIETSTPRTKTCPWESRTWGTHTLIANKEHAGSSTACGAEDLLRMAAAAEERSNHPLAHALVDAARARKLIWQPAEDVQVLPGRGLSATVEGHMCLLGNEALFREFFVTLPLDAFPPPEPGVTRLWMALDNVPVGCFDARDALRPDAVEAVDALRRAGLRVLMLTGDSAAATAPIAQQAGVTEWEAGLDPAGKLARIRALQQSGLRVAMVGDGINDAAALAQADAGIAMGTGADLAQEAGDVLLLSARPAAIPAAIDLARSTLRVMRQNLIWAAAYNLLGIPLAAGALYPSFHILLSPWVAAAAMALSSVSVLANSLRLRGWAPAVRQTLSMRSQ
jgi:Cu+-exporting ATPase